MEVAAARFGRGEGGTLKGCRCWNCGLQRMIFLYPVKEVFASARQDIRMWGALSSQESYISSDHRTEGPVQTDKGDTLQL